MARVLIVGESWVVQTTHIKGVDHFTATSYEEGVEWLRDALVGAGHSVTHLPSHLVPASFPDADGLAAFDVVMLSDIGADSILLHPDTLARSERTPDRLAALRDFVAAGGGVAMIGGWMSFSGYEGRAGFGRTALADVLPVTLLEGDDRVERPDGVTPEVTAGGGAHPVLAGIDAEWPWFLGYNRVIARPEARVLLTCDDDPFLVVGSFGAGRSLAFASDCAPHWAPPGFLEWSAHDAFWSQAADWLAGPAR